MERYFRRNYIRQIILLVFIALFITFSNNGVARDFITDRPSRTESPYTVDSGHLQFETDFFAHTHKQTVGAQTTTTRKYYFNQINLKAGLTPKMDLQMIIPTYVISETDVDGIKDIRRGFGDVVLRFKMNFLGNDEGPIALGAMPFVKTPTAASNLGNSKFEGGLILPIAIHLPMDWEIGTMAQVNYFKNENNSNYHATFISSFFLGHPIIGELAGYAEFYSESSGENSASWLATADLGLTYMANSYTQFDIGVNLGVTPATDSINPFAGLSMKF
jgi:hypothetical protein